MGPGPASLLWDGTEAPKGPQSSWAELLRPPKHRFPGKISLRALGHPEKSHQGLCRHCKSNRGAPGVPKSSRGAQMEQDTQQGWGPSCLSLLPLLFPFHQGSTKANQELREAEGARGIESTEKQMEGFEGPWWHQNPYGSTRGITIKEQKPLGTREGHQTQMNSICERPGGFFQPGSVLFPPCAGIQVSDGFHGA